MLNCGLIFWYAVSAELVFSEGVLNGVAAVLNWNPLVWWVVWGGGDSVVEACDKTWIAHRNPSST